jgi:hypothetical protein
MGLGAKISERWWSVPALSHVDRLSNPIFTQCDPAVSVHQVHAASPNLEAFKAVYCWICRSIDYIYEFQVPKAFKSRLGTICVESIWLLMEFSLLPDFDS